MKRARIGDRVKAKRYAPCTIQTDKGTITIGNPEWIEATVTAVEMDGSITVEFKGEEGLPVQLNPGEYMTL